MKILRIIRGGFLGDSSSSRFEVLVAEILTGYFNNAMQPVVCLISSNQIIRPNETLSGVLLMKTERYSSEERVFAGILDATDEELNVLNRAGYKVRDLRAITLATFLKGVGIDFQ